MADRGGVDIRVLGPVEVWAGGVAVPVSPLERQLLAKLALGYERVVPVGEIIDALWETEPPRSARNRVQALVSGLRGKVGPVVVTRAPGYALVAGGAGVDLARFDAALVAAREMADEGRSREAIEALRRADELWRGVPLGGTEGEVLAAAATRLVDRRLAAVERRIELELAAGWERDLVPELRSLLAEHPFRESLVGALMTALYRSDRRAEALEVYEAARRCLAEQLGLDPGTALQDLHQRVLRADPALRLTRPAAPAGPRRAALVPAELPADVVGFTGRSAELAAMNRRLCAAGSGTGMRICVIAGTAGVGKTALAVHFGHSIAGRFSDGQLYVNLRGYGDQPPVAPLDALGWLLSGLGVPADQRPTQLDTAAAMYRSKLAGRRVLVVLDNARTAEQVRPLLPGSATAAVVVTSRDRLGGLVASDGAHRIDLAVMGSDEAVDLLGHVVGPDRTGAEPAAAESLARECGHLPLALRLAAANLVNRPGQQLSRYLAELRRDGRVDALEIDRGPHGAIRTAFDHSYQQLSAAAQRLFRLLGVVPGVTVGAAAAAATADLPVRESGRLLDELTAAHLVEEPSPGRYGFHDLLRDYAASQAHRRDAPADRAGAVDRLLNHYLSEAQRVARQLYPADLRRVRDARGTEPELSWQEAVDWIEVESANLLAVVEHTGDRTDAGATIVVRLAAALYRPLEVRGYLRENLTIQRRAVAIARGVGDRDDEAQAREDLGHTLGVLGHLDESIRENQAALGLWEAVGNPDGRTGCLVSLGITYRHRNDLVAARTCFERALEIARETDNTAQEASVLNNLGLVHQRENDDEKAIACLTDALNISRATGYPIGEVIAQANLGWTHARAGRPVRAIAHHEASRVLARELGDRYNEAEQLWGLGEAHHALGHAGEARDHWHRALTILEEIGSVSAEEAADLRRQDVPDTPEIIRLYT